ncbi:hypothetical protein [Emcibacter sp.]|uniref:hypothetical protein n=1 Tax=Emcibacter sp. TaxID=1979954 RepID=UPI002AA76970|nr:hypothetical protein [Emcibacter sp.]
MMRTLIKVLLIISGVGLSFPVLANSETEQCPKGIDSGLPKILRYPENVPSLKEIRKVRSGNLDSLNNRNRLVEMLYHRAKYDYFQGHKKQLKKDLSHLNKALTLPVPRDEPPKGSNDYFNKFPEFVYWYNRYRISSIVSYWRWQLTSRDDDLEQARKMESFHEKVMEDYPTRFGVWAREENGLLIEGMTSAPIIAEGFEKNILHAQAVTHKKNDLELTFQKLPHHLKNDIENFEKFEKKLHGPNSRLEYPRFIMLDAMEAYQLGLIYLSYRDTETFYKLQKYIGILQKNLPATCNPLTKAFLSYWVADMSIRYLEDMPDPKSCRDVQKIGIFHRNNALANKNFEKYGHFVDELSADVLQKDICP